MVLKRNGGRGSLAISTTFYEQVCDVFMLTTASIAGFVILLFGLGPITGGLLVVAAFAAALIAMGPIFVVGAVLFAGVRRLVPAGRIASGFGTFAEVLRRLAGAPWQDSFTMMSYSALRLILQTSHGLAVALVFVPSAPALLVAAGLPIALLSITIPISPSGLGVAEWSWSGLLILAGATPASAAVATVVSRALYMIAIGVVSSVLVLLRLLRILRSH
jgi:hypothetical protein